MTKDGEVRTPVGFWKFVIVASIALTWFRGFFVGSGFRTDSVLSMLPFALAAWLAYRFARLQPWWPFASKVSSAKPSERSPNRLKHNSKASVLASASASRATPRAGSFKGSVSASGISTVGVRAKAVRTKTIRRKVIRRKRDSGAPVPT